MFDLGDVWALVAYARNDAGVLTNAGTVSLTITLPDGTAVSPTVTNPPTTTGTYVYDYIPTVAGRHVARWLLTFSGGATAAYTEIVDVAPAADIGIISLADAKAHLNIPATSTGDDEELRAWISATTAVVEFEVGPCLRRTYTQRVGNGAYWMLHTVPALAVTSVAGVLTGAATVSFADLDLDPDTGQVQRLDGAAFTGGPWTVTYTAGRAVIPPNVTSAAKIILKHLWETQRGAGRPSWGGQDPDLVAGPGFAIPHRALELLRPHKRGPQVA